ncbi:chemotaxis protein CheC [Anaerosalibacter bizertensis]|uniref:Chemotaxis protein CheC n=1 Tax=Anaerosalibacter bizertensis TaxID=932217 RepID=A0A9Q4AC08_9FIRM|nr:chemotaxis protein CheC [Anaerosalibacter bizertensis]MBV1818040.1 chemotaxis protein CheC [Bacteroidales bacterium MSK.15.36]MBU5293273.1 chemotaxis protein CheC [Anaerosalibacter bizertensis]MCB5558797.1 chemotaxis protein CheC [Anaerosalibacter bizertensis]MCG4564629.1 chemotaxis protein CheC [Anaerosalibacter bizertensis]MCG4582676.1 chemotaxis protein CheC [Anaerosalibacter bizertensis]
MAFDVDDITIDVLKELGNIGSGNAATALATLISKKVDMDVPQVKILDFKDVPKILGGEEVPVVGIYFEMSGEIIGNIMFVLSLESGKNLTNILFNKKNNSMELDEMDMSALSEIGNILASSYINSLSALTGLKLTISVPSLATDMAGAILSVPAIQYGYIADHVLFIETQFQEGDKKVTGNLFMIPEIDSFKKLLKSLGVC